MPRQDALAKAGREALDLRLDALGHVVRRAVRHVAVYPGDLFSLRCAGNVEEALLRYQHERTFRWHTAPDGPLRCRDLLQRAAQMYRACLAASLSRPRYRSIQGVIELEDAGAIAIPCQPGLIAGWQTLVCQRQQLARRDITEDRVRCRELVQRRDPYSSDDLAAKRAQTRNQSIGDTLGSAAWERPADRMCRHCEHQPERRAGRLFQWQHRMR